jgi:two-component system, OmpR family, sensor kinase
VTSNIDGNGVGLAIAKRLVERQGGQIQVTSKLDHGSTFRFALPLAD